MIWKSQISKRSTFPLLRQVRERIFSLFLPPQTVLTDWSFFFSWIIMISALYFLRICLMEKFFLKPFTFHDMSSYGNCLYPCSSIASHLLSHLPYGSMVSLGSMCSSQVHLFNWWGKRSVGLFSCNVDLVLSPGVDLLILPFLPFYCLAWTAIINILKPKWMFMSDEWIN